MSKIFRFFSDNKKILVLTIGLGLVLSLLPLHFAQAAWWDIFPAIFDYILTLPLRIAVFIMVLFFLVLAFFTGILYAIVAIIANWIIHVTLLVGVTPGKAPQIIEIGWTFTRDFANMFFIVLLVFIGLATILRLKEHEAKKALPRLIIVALLINFTPVIVGFIVDISNIVINFFVSQLGGIAVLELLLTIWGELARMLGDVWIITGDIVSVIGQLTGIMIYGAVAVAFFVYATWIYFLVAHVFLYRILMLWLLMILAPIAFLSYIIPLGGTGEKLFPSVLHWKKWWEELIHWAIFGIPMAFFLYLSNWIMRNTTAIQDTFQTDSLKSSLEYFQEGGFEGFETAYIGLIVSMIAPLFALFLLHKGWKISKEASPEAAQALMKGVEKAVKGLGKLALTAGITAATMGAGAGAAAGILGKGAAGAARAEAFMGKKLSLPLPHGKRFELGKWAIRPFTTPFRAAEAVIAPYLEKYTQREEEIASKAGEETKKRDVKGNLRALRRMGTTAPQQREILSTMIDLEQHEDALDPYVAGREALSREEILKAYENARKKGRPKTAEKFERAFGKDDTIRTEMANIVDETTAKLAPEKRTGAAGQPSGISQKDIDEGIKTFEYKIIAGTKTLEEMKQLQKKWWDNPKLMEAAQKFWGGPQLGRAADEFGRRFVEDYMGVANKLIEKIGVEEYAKRHPKQVLYLSGNAAQDLGYEAPEGLGRDAIRRIIKRSKEEESKRKEEARRIEERARETWKPEA